MTVRALVATPRTQGAKPGDYYWCADGELVYLGMVCDSDAANPDGGCGCGRGFAGLNSHRATTTAEVVDLPYGMADYVEAMRSGLAQQGWDPTFALDLAEAIVAAVADLPHGTIVERRVDELRIRQYGDEQTGKAAEESR